MCSSCKGNRLSKSSSPYLQQHANNPVDWYEWSQDALDRAKAENKLLIVSIGYAACHWCHVMAHESFMDDGIADYMNKHFISVKVDREERPDIDDVYMNAVQLISGRGGWPLNAFALPDGKPFYGVTYLPPERWLDLLKRVVENYQHNPGQVNNYADKLMHVINQEAESWDFLTNKKIPSKTFDKSSYKALFNLLDSYVDYDEGGNKNAPKFPMPVQWEFLLQYHHLTGRDKALKAVVKTLDAMDQGGIYDQIGGGFARYSVDDRWHVPHFEKMLYDNAQLVSLYAHAYQVTKKARYAEVITETLSFIEREMTDPVGGLYSSINADSEGVEGKFYVWTKSEFIQAVDSDYHRLLLDYYQVTDEGNWEHGNNILNTKTSKERFSKSQGYTVESFNDMLSEQNRKLLAIRNKRIRPSTDDKVLTSWNALMIKGYLDAYRALGNKDYLNNALRIATFIKDSQLKGNQLFRVYRDGQVSIDGFLDDYAFFIQACVELYQVTFDKAWLDLAKQLVDHTISYFYDENKGLFYYTSDEGEKLVVRKMETSDNVIPASNSVMAQALYKLGHLYGSDTYLSMCKKMILQLKPSTEKYPNYHANWALLAGMFAYGSYDVAIVGSGALEKNKKLQEIYFPNVLFFGGAQENLPLLEGKKVKDKTNIYVCKNKVCQRPVSQVEDALSQIE